MLTTTLNEILMHEPCGIDSGGKTGFSLLLKNLGKTVPDDEPLTVMQILESNGIEDAVWSLQCFDYRDYCLFLADVAESVLHIYEAEYDNPAPRLAIQGIRDYHSGKITKKELIKLSDSARAAARTTAASTAAAYAADAAYAAVDGDGYSVVDAAEANARAAASETARAKKWQEIEELFIKHFGD
jgi:hypothetical protein